MLRIIIFFCFCVAGVTRLQAQAHMAVDSTTHTFGEVKQGENPIYTFMVKNTGNSPLIINSVEPSCGCVTASYTGEPIPPGGSGAIQLVFVTETHLGFQLRSTTISTNADNAETVLYMKGTVIKRKGLL